jgi:formate dehydrogenase assembly factor FdhD
LEDITVGTSVGGITGGTAVSIVAVKWHGINAMTVTVKNAIGIVAKQILYRNSQSWIQQDVEEIAVGYAISKVIAAYVKEVKEHKMKLIDKTAKEVKIRLTAEIQYWAFRAAALKMKEAAGKSNSKRIPN